MPGFEHIDVAQRVRDIIKMQAQKVVDQSAPRPNFGRVVSINFAALTATVWFPGDDEPVPVKLFSSTLPGDWHEKYTGNLPNTSLVGFGSIVAVQRIKDSLYITHVLNGGQFSLDFGTAGYRDIAYDENADPRDAKSGAYAYTLYWDAIGNGLPQNGGPYAINVGPFMPNRNEGPPFGSTMEVDIISSVGCVQRYEFPLNTYWLAQENNVASPNDRWYRVLPTQVDEIDKTGSSGRLLNKYSNFPDTGIVGDWTAGTNTSIAQSNTFSNSGGGSLRIQSTNAAQAIIEARTDPTSTSTKYQVIGGAQYNCLVDCLSPSAWAAGFRTAIDWYDSANAFISTTTNPTTALSASVWANSPFSIVTAPTNAAYAVWKVQVVGTPPTSQLFYFDNIGFATSDSVTKTEVSLEVCLRNTIHGSTDASHSNSQGELWFRLYIDWLDSFESTNWTVKISNTAGFTRAKSNITGKPIYEYVTSPPATSGYLGYHDSNAGFTIETGQYYTQQDGFWSTGPWRNPDLGLGRRAHDTLVGGGNITWDGSNFKWSSPFEVGGIGRSRNGLTLGRATLACPTSGQMPVFPGGSAVTVTSSGIPLAAGQALYFGIPPGATSVALPNMTYFNGGLHGTGGLFIVDSANSFRWWSPPEWAVLIAYRQTDSAQAEIKCGNGEVIDKWRSATLSAGWTNRGAGFPVASYRKLPGNNLHLIGQIVPGTKTDGTVIFTLPTGFRPNNEIAGNIVRPAAGTAGGQLYITPSGSVTLDGIGAGTNLLQFNFIIPLVTI